MAFKFRYSLLGENGRMLRKYVLDASGAFQVGDALVAKTGETDLPFNGEVGVLTAGLRVLGIIESIVTADGMPPQSDGAGGAFKDAYTTPTNNETGLQISVIVDISPWSVYSVGFDDTINTTTGSELAFYYFDIDTGLASHQLNESTAAAPTTGSGQFVSHGRDPEDSDRVLVNIHETWLVGDSGI